MLKACQGLRVLILGGMGFIGSNLAHLLVKSGAQVTILDNFLPDHGANGFNLEGIRDQVQVHLGDLRAGEALRALLPEQQLIFNLAAQTSHSDSMRDPLLDLDINNRGNLVFLEACRAVNPTARIVYIGTRAYYGAPETPQVLETAPIKPLDVYAVNRFAAEQYHLIYHRHYGLPVSCLRLGNLYGPRAQMRHPRYNVLNYFIRLALEDETIQVYGTGEQVRDYLYIADACEALLAAGLSDQAIGQIYNVGSGKGTAFRDLVKQILSLAGQGNYRQIDWPEGTRAFDVGDVQMDIGKIGRELNWQPQTTLSDGLQQTLNYYRQHSQHYWSSERITP